MRRWWPALHAIAASRAFQGTAHPATQRRCRTRLRAQQNDGFDPRFGWFLELGFVLADAAKQAIRGKTIVGDLVIAGTDNDALKIRQSQSYVLRRIYWQGVDDAASARSTPRRSTTGCPAAGFEQSVAVFAAVPSRVRAVGGAPRVSTDAAARGDRRGGRARHSRPVLGLRQRAAYRGAGARRDVSCRANRSTCPVDGRCLLGVRGRAQPVEIAEFPREVPRGPRFGLDLEKFSKVNHARFSINAK